MNDSPAFMAFNIYYVLRLLRTISFHFHVWSYILCKAPYMKYGKHGELPSSKHGIFFFFRFEIGEQTHAKIKMEEKLCKGQKKFCHSLTLISARDWTESLWNTVDFVFISFFCCYCLLCDIVYEKTASSSIYALKGPSDERQDKKNKKTKTMMMILCSLLLTVFSCNGFTRKYHLYHEKWKVPTIYSSLWRKRETERERKKKTFQWIHIWRR